MKVKYRVKDHFPRGTVIKGGWADNFDQVRTIYKNKLDENGWLRWSEKPDEDRLTHSWSIIGIEVVVMGNETKVATEESG